jgi:hypothetical protein
MGLTEEVMTVLTSITQLAMTIRTREMMLSTRMMLRIT